TREAFRIEQREVGALAEVRAGGVRGIAHQHNTRGVDAARERMLIAGKRKSIETADVIQHFLRLRTQRDGFLAEGGQTTLPRGLYFIAPNAPEKCTAPTAMRQQPQQPARAARDLMHHVDGPRRSTTPPKRTVFVFATAYAGIQPVPQPGTRAVRA